MASHKGGKAKAQKAKSKSKKVPMEACYSVIETKVHIHLEPEYFNNIKLGVQTAQ